MLDTPKHLRFTRLATGFSGTWCRLQMISCGGESQEILL